MLRASSFYSSFEVSSIWEIMKLLSMTLFSAFLQCYRQLTTFEASGSVTYPALCFLWQRATNLQSLRITQSIVLEVSLASGCNSFDSGLRSPLEVERAWICLVLAKPELLTYNCQVQLEQNIFLMGRAL